MIIIFREIKQII